MRQALLFILFAAGCGGGSFRFSGDGGGPFGSDLGRADGGGADGPLAPQRLPVELAQRTRVDLLFMVDNSNSMEAMASELRNRFPRLLDVFTNLAQAGAPVSLHLGVVTSDYGAGMTGAPGCQVSPGGQRGRLQPVGAASPPGCLPPIGANYVQYDFANNANNNLPAGLSLAQTFTCMAAVGSNGCGFEHPLESVYAALHNNLPENTGFLRPDALLVVVFVTNEDDSSAPASTDIFDKTLFAKYGYESSYRSVRFGIVCGNPRLPPPYADSGGPLDPCFPAPVPPGEEFDVARYVDFFTKPAAQGGVKADPRDVVLFAIDAPEEPVEVILANPATPGGQPYAQCPQLNEASNPPCVPVVQHSCVNPFQPTFFGDPAVRLNAVVKAVPSHGLASICDNDYGPALQRLGALLGARLGGGCVGFPLPVDGQGAPVADCLVEDVVGNQRTRIPACSNMSGFPCYRLATQPSCGGISPQGVALLVDRNGQPPPAGATTTAACAPAP